MMLNFCSGVGYLFAEEDRKLPDSAEISPLPDTIQEIGHRQAQK